MAQPNNFEFFKGEHPIITFTMTPTTDITGWTITFTLKDSLDNPQTALLTVSATLTTPASGIFTVELTAAQMTRACKQYGYDVWRTDSGAEACLSVGQFLIKPNARVAG